MSRAPYDKHLEQPYEEHERGRLYDDEDNEPRELDADDWRDEIRDQQMGTHA